MGWSTEMNVRSVYRRGVSIIVTKKNLEIYVVMYDSKKPVGAHSAIGRWAANPDLSFDWVDAEAMAEKVLEQFTEHGW